MTWYEVPAGEQLFAEFNRIAPARDTDSDGTIGDAAHQKEHSDHNPDSEGAVRADDVDNDLYESDLTMEKVVQFLLGRCRSGAEKRITYIIYYRRIWAADTGWVQKTYTGSSQHTEHAHFSFSHSDKLANSTASFHLEDIPVALTNADKAWIIEQINVPFKDTGAKDKPESVAGHAAGVQQYPDHTQSGDPQVPQYVAFSNLVDVVMDIKSAVATVENNVETIMEKVDG